MNAFSRMAIVALALTALVSCTPTPEPAEAPSAPSTGPMLRFTVDGAGFAGRTFGPDLTDVTDHWLYDPRTKQTRIHISGNDGDWRGGIDFVVSLSGPGRYQADRSYRDMDRGFSVAIADHRNGNRIALIGVDAVVELEPNDGTPDQISGTFSGRFAVGHRTTGKDILGTPPDERTYATIRDGRFRAHFKDTLHGEGRTWPSGPRS